MDELLIIIVNYRTPRLVIDCLASLAPQVEDVKGTSVVVVDNASNDGSAEMLRESFTAAGWNTWARVIETPANGGFSYGNNVGLAAGCDSRYVLYLNSDTIAKAGCLRYCVTVMSGNPTIGAMSCQVLNTDGSIQNIARLFPTPLRMWARAFGLPWSIPRLFSWANLDDPFWPRTAARDVDWLGGAFLFVRRKVIDRIGALDEDFFFYGEDIEFCHRVWRAGYHCHFSPGAQIVHFGGSSSDTARGPSLARLSMALRARYLVQRKCYGRLAEISVRCADAVAQSARMAKLLLRNRRIDARFKEQWSSLNVMVGRGVAAI